MSLLLSPSDRPPRKLPPAGTHVARCYLVVDLGTHISPKFNKSQEKLLLGFELPTELEVFKENGPKEPFTMSKKFTASLDERGHLIKFLTAWRGRPFEKSEKFLISKVLGSPAQLGVIHKPRTDDPTQFYAEISSISSLMKGMTCPAAINKPLLYEMKDGANAVFAQLPKWIRELIQQSTEAKQNPKHYILPEGAVVNNQSTDMPADDAPPF